MKKNDIILIVSTLLFSVLFYKQFAGINFLLFSLGLCFFTAITKPEITKNKLWIFASALTIAGGFAIFLNSTILSVIAWFIAASYLAGVTASNNASPGTAVSYSVFSYITSIGFMFVDMVERSYKRNRTKKRKINWNAVFTMSVFIIIVVLLFFFMYQKANPLFKEITKFINLDFLSFQWIMFTFWGFLMMYGFIYVRYIRKIDAYETLSPQYINKEKCELMPNKFLWFTIDEKIEFKSGIILLLLLNIMILTINVLDISYLWSGAKLPEGFTFAGYLHQGIYTLIFSSVLAILLILFVFRGKLNFIQSNKYLKWLALAWIAQNILISVSCSYRNIIYISNYALTYKRITIFVLLFLVIVGLITAIIKINKTKNIYFLYRFNSFVVIAVLVFTSLINWDKIITRYNLKHSINPDIEYLSTLNHSGIPDLLEFIETDYIEEERHSTVKTNAFYDNSIHSIENRIYDKAYKLLERRHNYGWRSYNLSVDRTISKINKLYKEGPLNKFVLRDKNDFDISLLYSFSELNSLILARVNMKKDFHLTDLETFANLKELKMAKMDLDSINKLPEFTNLEYVDFSQNNISNFERLAKYDRLKSIIIDDNPVTDISFVKEIPGLEHLSISKTGIKDLSVLSHLENLKSLHVSNMTKTDFKTLPECRKLNEIDLSYNDNLYAYKNIPAVISNAPNLENVYLRSISIRSLTFFTDPVVKLRNRMLVTGNAVDTEVLQNIKLLDIAQNNLHDLRGLEEFKGIKTLNASSNRIQNISNVKNVPNLETLYLQDNPVESINDIRQLKSLKSIHFSGFKFSDISALSSLSSIKALTLSRGTIQETSPLTELKELEYLDLSKTHIPSLDFIEEMTSLKYIDLSFYSGDDLEKLLLCPSLEVIVIPPSISKELENKLREEIPQIKIIFDYKPTDKSYYLSKYAK
ncbi:MAG: DUF4153 domain-containing protein [Bacteroidales bacterium]